MFEFLAGGVVEIMIVYIVVPKDHQRAFHLRQYSRIPSDEELYDFSISNSPFQILFSSQQAAPQIRSA
jgi:hypothetical protein